MRLIYTILILTSFASEGFAQAWSKLPDVPVSLAFPVVVALGNDIHVIGGGATGGATKLHLRFRTETKTWDTLAPVPYRAQQPGGVSIQGQIHYFGGGYPNSGTRLNDHFVYDPNLDNWTEYPSLPIPRVIHKTAVLGDSIFALSGQPDKERVDVFVLTDSAWITLKDLPDQDFWYGAITSYKGQIYRFGGGGSISPSAKTHVYNRINDSWSNLASLSDPVHAPSASVLGDSIYITGGFINLRYSTQCLVYNPKTKEFGKGPSFPDARSYHTTVAVNDCIYSIGGHNNGDTIGTSFIRHCTGDPFSNLSFKPLFEQGLKVFITPSRQLVIERGYIDRTIGDVSLYSLNGTKIWSTTISGTKKRQELTLPSFANGIYMCEVTLGKQRKVIRIPLL